MAGLLRYALEYGRNVEKHESAMASQKQARDINTAASARLKIENERADKAYKQAGTMKETADVLQAYKTGNKFKMDQILNNKEGYLNKLGINKVIGGWGGVVPEGGIRFEKITPSVGIEPEKRETLRNMTTEDQDRIMNMVYPTKLEKMAPGQMLVNVSGGEPTPAFTAPAAEDQTRFTMNQYGKLQTQGQGAGKYTKFPAGAAGDKRFAPIWGAMSESDRRGQVGIANSWLRISYGGSFDSMGKLMFDIENRQEALMAADWAEFLLQQDMANGGNEAAKLAATAAKAAILAGYSSVFNHQNALRKARATGRPLEPETNTSIIKGSNLQQSLLKR